MSIEENIAFKRIDNILDYVREGIKSGNLTVDEVAKFARIYARQGIPGEEVITKMKNNLEETKNIVTIDKITGEPGWIVTNPDGEEYIIQDSTFKKKYEIDTENPKKYKPRGVPVLSTVIEENIEFIASWGETMKISAGGSLIISTPNDIYGIQEAEFKNTYASTGKAPTECLKEALSLFEISKEEFLQARERKTQETYYNAKKTDDDAPGL